MYQLTRTDCIEVDTCGQQVAIAGPFVEHNSYAAKELAEALAECVQLYQEAELPIQNVVNLVRNTFMDVTDLDYALYLNGKLVSSGYAGIYAK